MDAPNVPSRALRNPPRRLKAFHDKAIELGLATEDAFQAAINLLDPFPDGAIEAVGWPSSSGSHTVPLAITAYKPISAPAGVTTTWNYKVLFMPFTDTYVSDGIYNYDFSTGLCNSWAGDPYSLGQFSVWTWRSEDPEPDWLISPPTSILTCSINNSWSRLRMCAAGFETINTSADLYRGGMQYGWRAPNVNDACVTMLPTLPAVNTRTVLRDRYFSGVPENLNQVTNLQDTFTGHSRNGIGVFSLPMASENPSVSTMPTRLSIVGGSKLRTQSPNTLNLFDWMPCGVYCTGLTAESTFQLKCRVFYELWPTTETTTLIQAIARVPTPHSYAVNELLDAVLSHMPSAFDYSENPLGEWLHKILGLMAHAAPIIGGLIPHPVGKVAAAAITPALTAAARATKPSPKPKKEKPKTAPPPAPKKK